ncbi:WecB/TagA/CpsF family glycosyltransferase [Flammeovirga kamogawensis]|uniref:WecB/TagA/CpsF family glycosyltransferase n=1 Tax=Flammeovirga kamogawensis TaxID=373891 RepID=A0ABX8GSN5_9BACT|nr:WecB/TagA/CpsF family glycosyltransferase [Flammeovirga kamogawensis]MBB6461533.1 N-acetylglucosaminyldiphosphoundecaprenol N-acetyl-beta-D-mannosaminyltransferase [Flammeovirga kamogawensis]QWG06423.1 WecB/TagA/CpsF family glycosyltransferase [Flammeovirga kamogawensis]TRX68252.1 WecB/TagA/CpsF family glycosyltransferase [Flammeovirga kamogawensis]
MILNVILKKNEKERSFTFLNPASYVEARKNLDVYSKLDTIYIDGVLLVKFLHFFCRAKQVERQSFDMTSLAPIVFNNAIQESKTIYFIGSTQEAIEGFVKVIQSQFKGLIIKGFRSGYIRGEENKVAEDIIAHNPDIVVVGMGAPLQEQFLITLIDRGFQGIGYTCGGFIHQTSTSIRYYPKWVDKYNLRMPYRLYVEPEFRKKLPNYFKFCFYFFCDLIDYYKQENKP